jgi:hypothetical protein
VRSPGSTPRDNFYPTSVKPEFVDYAGGNYNLKADSVYKNAGTDGKDLGADWTVLNASTATVTSGVWGATNTPTPTATPTMTTDHPRLTPKQMP